MYWRRGSYSVTGIVIVSRDKINTVVILSRSYSITLHRSVLCVCIRDGDMKYM